MAAERLQKILAAAGIASRRKAEELIAEGHVSVNGTVITEPGTKADSRMDEIRVDGQLIGRPERHVYFMLYKPKGVVTTLSDPEGRETISDLIKGIKERVFPVGRLDYMSEGLLLLTNDGELMAQLTHAKTHVPKTYMVKVSGHPTEEQIDRLRAGINLPPEPGLAGARGKKQPGVERRSFAVKTAPAEIDLVRDQENPWYQVTLIEGRNRQIRRMFEEIGYHIEKIKRIRYGTLELNVEPGEVRQLTFGEVNELRKSLARPYTIQSPRRKDGERRVRPSKAAQRGFPKPERERRSVRPPNARPREEFRTRPTGEGFTPREREDFAPRRDSGDRPAYRDRKSSFGQGKPPKRFDRERAMNDREFRGPEGRSRSAGSRSERPQYGSRDASKFTDSGTRPPRRDFGERGSRPPRREFSESSGETRRPFRDRKSSFGPGKPAKRSERREFGEGRPPRRERPFGEGGFRGGENRGRGASGGNRGPRGGADSRGRGPSSGGRGPRDGGRGAGGNRGGSRPSGPRGRR